MILAHGILFFVHFFVLPLCRWDDVSGLHFSNVWRIQYASTFLFMHSTSFFFSQRHSVPCLCYEWDIRCWSSFNCWRLLLSVYILLWVMDISFYVERLLSECHRENYLINWYLITPIALELHQITPNTSW